MTDVQKLAIDTIRTLSMDAVQKANSGHPGTPMALAPPAYVLWMKHLRHNPSDPTWLDRDRFVLSCGHASMLLYSMLHLTGYGLELDELKDFRQWGSRTPGHPENHMTPGVETTTGPLGQGFANGVGMAIAERFLADRFNRPGHEIIDHRVWTFCSDGDLMEGVSTEAASIAGHLKLGKLIYLWDDNRITIEGDTDLTFVEDVGQRFEALGWHVVPTVDANDVEALDEAFAAGRAETGRPTLIVCRSHIGYPSPNKQDTASAHGSPLGDEEIRLTKEALGWPVEPTFHVPEEAAAHMLEARTRGQRVQDEWEQRFLAYREAHPDLAAELMEVLDGRLPMGWDSELPKFGPDSGKAATRKISGLALNGLARTLPTLIGGSADLAPSNKTIIDGGGDFGPEKVGRNLRFGIREHGMASIANGMSLHGGVRPYVATFLIFSDYARPAIRLAALMGLPVIYVFTHDSIGLGEDGPTHQPVESLAALRSIPNLTVIRPADAAETVAAWRWAVAHSTADHPGPVALVLTRQGVPALAVEHPPMEKGGWVVAEGEDVVLIGTGSEVGTCLEAREVLAEDGIRARVVTLPSWEIFAAQTEEYRAEVLSPDLPRVAIEAGVQQGWERWIGSGRFVGLDRFGASAPAEILFQKLGVDAPALVAATRDLLGRG